MRIRKTLVLAASAALIAACGTGDDEPSAQPPEGQEAPQEGEDPFGEQPDFADPNEQVADNSFRGEGIVLPVPDGWRVDEMAFAQGLVLAMPEAGNEQFAGQAVETGELDQELDFGELIAANREQFETSPTEDEEVQIDGAEQAHLLRFDGLAPQQEGEPEGSLLLVMADNGEGRIAVFNYAAPTDAYDEDHANLLLSAAGFDPDSQPAPPAPMGEPQG